MKKLFFVLLISSGLTIANSEILTKEDFARAENKKHHDKAWRNFDRKVFKWLIASGIALGISKYISTRTLNFTPSFLYSLEDQVTQNTDAPKIIPRTEYTIEYTDKNNFPVLQGNLKNQTLSHNWLARYEKSDTKHSLFLSKPHLVKTFFVTTGILGTLDLLIKWKRASDHDSNVLSFLFTSIWA